MKTITQPVRHGKDETGHQKTVATIDVPQFDSIAEGCSTLGDALALDLLNRQTKVYYAGLERNKHIEGAPSKKANREAAFKLLTTDEQIRYSGDFEALLAFLDSPEMLARLESSRGVSATPATVS